MIKRELYMKRIRPFIGSDLVKVMTGIRRCGKSVMLELIKDELKASGVDSSQFISINFEDMRYTYLQRLCMMKSQSLLLPLMEKSTFSLMKFKK